MARPQKASRRPPRRKKDTVPAPREDIDCDGAERAIYGGDFSRHAYTDVVQSLVRRREALKLLSTGSESRQYLPLSVIKKADPKVEAVKWPRIAESVPPLLTVPVPTGPPASREPEIRAAQASVADSTTAVAQNLARVDSFYTPASASTQRLIGTAADLQAMAKALYGKPNAAGVLQPASDADVEKLKAELQTVQDQLIDAKQPLDAAAAKATALRDAAATGTLKVEDVENAAKLLGVSASRLGGKLDQVADTDPKQVSIYKNQNIDVKEFKKHFMTATTELATLKTHGDTLASLLKLGPVETAVHFAITGENFKSLKKVECSAGNEVLKFSNGLAPEAGGYWMRLQGDAVLFKVGLLKSAIVHFKLTFEVKDPTAEKGVVIKELYSPPIIFRVGDVAPIATGGVYVDTGFVPLSADATAPAPIMPLESQEEIALTEPPPVTRDARRMAKRNNVDFSTSLFPALPEN